MGPNARPSVNAASRYAASRNQKRWYVAGPGYYSSPYYYDYYDYPAYDYPAAVTAPSEPAYIERGSAPSAARISSRPTWSAAFISPMAPPPRP